MAAMKANLRSTVASVLALAACASVPPVEDPGLKKLTPILTVESIEPVLGFWVEGLGFQVTAEVPAGDTLGFVMLERDGAEVMLQTRASVQADDPRLAAELSQATACLYLEVADLDSILGRLDGAQVVVPKRHTFYGATEVFLRDPGGHVVGLAQMDEVPPEADRQP